MLKYFHLYEKRDMSDKSFPIDIYHSVFKQKQACFPNHWHPQIELLYFIRGDGLIRCNSNSIQAGPGDLIVINSNDFHYGESLCEELEYFILIVDLPLLQSSSIDKSVSKYIGPITQNHLLFNNKISNDRNIAKCMESIMEEYFSKAFGYDLAIKSLIYHLLILLSRDYVLKTLDENEYLTRNIRLENLYEVLSFIETHFTEDFSIDRLSRIAKMSSFHFCRTFKNLTGRAPIDYVNSIRLGRAETLIKTTEKSITEIALATGFNDINYFSRLFKKHKKMSPSQMRKGSS